MLRSGNELKGYILRATDGDIGSVKDFYFDSKHWTIRYMVADTGTWLPGRKVLISPHSLHKPDWAEKTFPVELTKQQIEESPGVDTEKPVSRRHQTDIHNYFGWPVYWTVGLEPAPVPDYTDNEDSADRHTTNDSELRSLREVEGYHIAATDGEIGHVEDFIIEDDTWVIRYMVVDTKNWLPGRKVLISPEWIKSVDHPGDKVHVGLVRDAVKNSPEYDPYEVLDREYETELFDHYGRPRYWV